MTNKYGCLPKNIDFDWLNHKGYFDDVWVYANNKYNTNNRNMIKYVKLHFKEQMDRYTVRKRLVDNVHVEHTGLRTFMWKRLRYVVSNLKVEF